MQTSWDRTEDKGRVGCLIQDLLEPAVIFIGVDGKLEGLFDVVQVFDGFGRQGGPDFLEERLQGSIEGYQLGQRKGDRHLVLDRIQQGPEILFVHPFGIDRKSGHLQGYEVPVNGSGIAVQPLSQFSGRFLCM
jgi:hypothetical protein